MLCWAQGLSFRVLCVPRETTLEKTGFSFVSSCQLEITSGLDFHLQNFNVIFSLLNSLQYCVSTSLFYSAFFNALSFYLGFILIQNKSLILFWQYWLLLERCYFIFCISYFSALELAYVGIFYHLCLCLQLFSFSQNISSVQTKLSIHVLWGPEMVPCTTQRAEYQCLGHISGFTVPSLMVWVSVSELSLTEAVTGPSRIF